MSIPVDEDYPASHGIFPQLKRWTIHDACPHSNAIYGIPFPDPVHRAALPRLNSLSDDHLSNIAISLALDHIPDELPSHRRIQCAAALAHLWVASQPGG